MTEEIATDGGFRWIQRPGKDDHLAFWQHEPELTRRLANQKGKTFIDVGAHVGRYSIRCASHFDTVWAWEPGATQREGLLQNCRNNNVQNVIVVPFAAWYENGWVPYGSRENDAQSNVLHQRGQEHIIPARRVDNLVRSADVVKIDVEGAEVQVLEGLDSILSYCHPRLFIEIHDWVDNRIPGRCSTLLSHYSYAIDEFQDGAENIWECS
jgi:FkbM family methyltransferase